jgi:peptidyl-prolyl cis-trans isomerase NIMA-interacting 1
MEDNAPMELDVAAVADAVEQATAGTGGSITNNMSTSTTITPGLGPPPPPLPPGWLMKQSRTNPMHYYFYEMETGYTTWDPPISSTRTMTTAEEVQDVLASLPVNTMQDQDQQAQQEDEKNYTIDSNDMNDDGGGENNNDDDDDDEAAPSSAKAERDGTTSASSSSSNKRRKTKKSPDQVRVLHILKKHKDSRRPSSWRQKVITQTREEAHEELKALLDLLEDDEDDPEALRATFEEIARTESDCSSAKRGGDLGYFTRGKMQPPFENASFALKKNELTHDIVDSSSGSHIILRIG